MGNNKRTDWKLLVMAKYVNNNKKKAFSKASNFVCIRIRIRLYSTHTIQQVNI